jgi:c-di-GMP-binding flagellar brake protein YcgR
MGTEFQGFQHKEIIIQKKSNDEPTLRYQSSLVGFKMGKYVIIDNPLVNGEPVLNAGDTGIVRYLDDGTVYGFESVILSIITFPSCLAFMKFPASIEEKALRKSIRVNTMIAVKVYLAKENIIPIDKPRSREGIIVNLSDTGCLLSFSEDLVSGNEMKLEMDLPNVGQMVIPKCVVRRVDKNKNGNMYGLEFMSLELSKKDTLTDFVSFCMSYLKS